MKKKGVTLRELVISLAILCVTVLLIVPAAFPPRSRIRRSCANHLMHMGLVFRMYCNEAPDGLFPPMQCGKPGDPLPVIAMAPQVSAIYPEYCTDPELLLCLTDDTVSKDDLYSDTGDCLLPEEPMLAGLSYVYFGWLFDRLDGETVPFVAGASDALEKLRDAPPYGAAKDAPVPIQLAAAFNTFLTDAWGDPPNPGASDKNLTVPPPYGNTSGDTIYRLHEGIERFWVSDHSRRSVQGNAQSEIFVMFDKIAAGGRHFTHGGKNDPYHKDPGCNVLFMDGHVEFIKFPGPAPVSQAMANFLALARSEPAWAPAPAPR